LTAVSACSRTNRACLPASPNAENRRWMMRLFHELFARHAVEPVEHYPETSLAGESQERGPAGPRTRPLVLLTQGSLYRRLTSARILAPAEGIELSKARRILRRDDILTWRTTRGPRRVDVVSAASMMTFWIHRLSGRTRHGFHDSQGVYRPGHVTLPTPWHRRRDDKVHYPTSDMVRFLSSEEPLLANVQTWLLRRPEEREHVLANLPACREGGARLPAVRHADRGPTSITSIQI